MKLTSLVKKDDSVEAHVAMLNDCYIASCHENNLNISVEVYPKKREAQAECWLVTSVAK